MDPIPPTIPFRLAKAYGTPAPAQTPAPAKPIATPPTQPAFKPDTLRPADKVDLSAATAAAKLRAKQTAQKLSALIAAKVDTAPYDALPAAQKPVPVSTTDAYPFYRRPSDANTVATEIAIGRSLDTSG